MNDARRARIAAIAIAVALVTVLAPSAAVSAASGGPRPASVASAAEPIEPTTPEVGPEPGAELSPTIHYEDYLAHEHDEIAFEPGDRVLLGFSPRVDDRWSIGGRAPAALPAGNASGAEMAAADQGTTWAVRAPTGIQVRPAAPDPTGHPVDGATPDPNAAPADLSALRLAAPDDGPTAPTAVSGLRREVFGFLPYWDVNDAILHWPTLSTVAYYAVGADKNGNLLKKNSDGSTTVGWSGWTSSRMTQVIQQAHANGSRVVLTVTVFAWTSSQQTTQAALLGSATARNNLAAQLAAAVRDRGADGVNLDFEPIVSGYDDEFTAFVRTLRSQLNAIAPGYQLTFDTTGYIGNYPIEQATAPGGADAVFIMGYDYRGSSSSPVGSIAPLRGPLYDLTETVAAFTARIPASKVILGVPYYGRAWSTSSSAAHASNTSGTKYGASASVIYSTAASYASQYGRRWDSQEASPYVAYQRENCTSTYGCVTSWRQIWYDDAQSLGEKYDLVNRQGLRGAGIWSLGYEGSRTELRQELSRKFRDDTTAPLAGVVALPSSQSSATFTVRWAGADDVDVASYDVEVAIDGAAWRRWLDATEASQASYVGAPGHTFVFRVRARDGSGNLSDWGVTETSPATASAGLNVGGFGIVVADQLNVRSAAGTGASKVATADSGTLLSITGGPTSKDGYTWYQVDLPIAQWPVVDEPMRGVWVAAGSSSTTYVSAAGAPHATRVSSGASVATGARFVPLSPARILDTRGGTGLTGKLASRTPRTFQVTGRGGVPSGAIAVTGNLTIVGQSSTGYLSLGPTMSGSPETSTLNAPKGDTRANGVTVKLAGDGTLGVVFVGGSGATTDVIFDVTGYLAPGSSGTTFFPIAGSRVLDTRFGNGLSGAFKSSTVRSFQVAGRGGLPADAVAITANVTVAGQTSSGYLSLGPTMTASPATSSLNIPHGDVRANNVTVALADGSLAAVWKGRAGSSAQVILDVTGYFRNTGSGATFFPIDPVRVLDDRVGNGLSGAFAGRDARSFPSAGRGTIPVDAVAIAANLTITGQTSGGYVALGPTMTSSPDTSTLNVPAGDTRANGATSMLGPVGTNGAVFVASSSARADLILDVTGYWR